MKRLRKKFTGRSIRFFHCGEYGELCKNCGFAKYECECGSWSAGIGRPHYHSLIFNFKFPDLKLHKIHRENRLYTSKILDKLWGFGHCLIGDLTFESAAYTARYCLKKITGKKAEAHYNGRKPEYTTMSRRPGIGKNWYEKYSSDVFPSDSVVLRGLEMRPPKFYDRQLEKTDPDLLEKLKKIRVKKGVNYTWQNWKGFRFKASDNDLDRLITKEIVKIAQLGTLTRKLE